MNTLTVVIGTFIVTCAIFTFGYSQGKQSARVTDFIEYVTLSQNMSDADTRIATLQAELATTRDKEVIKYVTIYRDRIKDPVIASAVRDSGILQVYDASVSAAVK